MPNSRRHVVITGAESGIGAACAQAFGQVGDHVTILYHGDAAAAEVSAQAVRVAGGAALTLQCAIDDPASVAAAFTEMEARVGAAAVLVNSAGVNMSGTTVRDMTVETWTRTLGTDLSGAFLVSKRFLSGLGDVRPAAIIHISSIHAEAVRAGGADYCAAKGGLTNLVRTLAIEEGLTGVRVNAIEPGMILTPMNSRAEQDGAVRHEMEQHIPLNRAGRPEEVANLARWLASDEAAYITGARIVIDGGLSLMAGLGA